MADSALFFAVGGFVLGWWGMWSFGLSTSKENLRPGLAVHPWSGWSWSFVVASEPSSIRVCHLIPRGRLGDFLEKQVSNHSTSRNACRMPNADPSHPKRITKTSTNPIVQ
jgi:hypothetical protein